MPFTPAYSDKTDTRSEAMSTTDTVVTKNSWQSIACIARRYKSLPPSEKKRNKNSIDRRSA